jgi:diguanylate cyclase (GGDEF)-like protein
MRRISSLHNTDEKLQKLYEKYAENLSELLKEVDVSWENVLDNHWDSQSIQTFHRVAHKIAGSSASFGFKKINSAVTKLEEVLEEILDHPVGATSEYQEKLEMNLDQLKDAFKVDQQLQMPELRTRYEEESIRQARSDQLLYLVEDDPIQAEEIAEQIGYFGYTVKIFTELPNLIAVVKETPPRAILMDVIFPEGMTAGPDTTAKLMKELEVPVPVIFLSQSNSMTSRLQAVRAGGEAYFTKPVDFGILIDELDQLTVHEEADTYRVLLVDDSPILAQATAKQLENFGMQVKIVHDHLKIIRELDDFKPNMILLDVFMADCNGLELAKVIRQLEKFVITPIIYLSSEDERDKQLDAMIEDADDFVPKSIRPDRLKNIMQSRMDRYRQLEALMVRDSLTGLYNHTMIKERLDQELSRASRQKTQLSFVMLDLDYFKSVNDMYGHVTGDRVLKSLARFLSQRFRKTDIIGRYGGEEFAVILPDTTLQSAVNLMNDIRESFGKVFHRGGSRDFMVTFSCGVASYPACENPALLIEAADQAMYTAKNSGRNRVVAASEKDR